MCHSELFYFCYFKLFLQGGSVFFTYAEKLFESLRWIVSEDLSL